MPASMPPVHIGNDEIIELRQRCYPIIDDKETNPEFKELAWTQTSTEFGKAMQRYFDYPVEKRIPLAQYETGEKLVEWYGVQNPYPKPDFPNAHPFPLNGVLKVGKKGYYTDANGPVFPMGVHFGDGFLCQTEGRDIEPQLMSFREVGAHFTRQWITLMYYKQGNPGHFWGTRGCSPAVTPNFWQQLERNIEMHIEYELKMHLSFGDLNNVPLSEVQANYDKLGDLVSKYGSQHFIFPGEVNECIATYSGASGSDIANLVNRIRVRNPENLYALSSYTGYTSLENIKAYTAPWQDVYYKHGFRDGHYWDKIRHYFSDGYEYFGKEIRTYGADHEPAGWGKYVSATANAHEINESTMGLMAVSAALAKQSFVYFCSAGIKWEDQSFEGSPGYATVFKLVNMLPKSLTYGTLHHSGDRWQNLSVFGAVNEFRIDGIIREDTGEFAYVAYGPEDRVRIPVRRSADFTIINPKTLEAHSFSANRGEVLPELGYDQGFVITGKTK